MTALTPFLQSFDAAKHAYEAAWNDPNHTTFELPAVEVNDVLRRRYKMSPKRMLTKAQVWDMEEKKAWDPKTYIPYVVFEGGSWGRITLSDRTSRFSRSSIQKAWISDERGRVLEDVYVGGIDHGIYFFGCRAFPDQKGNELQADSFQPLFHVWHGVGGSDDAPTNLWSIVLLTPEPDPRYSEPFKTMVREGWLPGFIEIYIKRDLRVDLSRA